MGAVVEGSAGTGAGERKLNGPQTTGRDYRNLVQDDRRARLLLAGAL
jgi:hypothetical protein